MGPLGLGPGPDPGAAPWTGICVCAYAGPGGPWAGCTCPAPGCTCRVHYEARWENGDVFDSSRDRKRALIFKLGAGQLIPGLEDGIPKMSVGQICVFTVPPALGYGQEGFMPVVPPAATLTYEVELLDFSAEDDAGHV